MKAVNFPEANQQIAETQNEFQTLPAHVTKDGRVTICFELDEAEKLQVIETGQIWFQLYNGKRDLAPIGPSLLDPRVTREAATNSDDIAYEASGDIQKTDEQESN